VTSERPPPPAAGTPLTWRLGLLALVAGLAALATAGDAFLGPRGRAACGLAAFLALAAACSSDLRAVNRHTLLWGIALQVGLAVLVLKVEINGRRPGYEAFQALGDLFKTFLAFADKGADFVFGPLGPSEMKQRLGRGAFAFSVLPTIIFVSSFFTVLYHLGVLQKVVQAMAWLMSKLMRTSGAETLSVTANVVMGQTEAPLIVKPYVERLTESELLALMVGGMAHISGGLLAAYIDMGADPVAIIATSVMASPCSLYLAKVVMPELGRPDTLGSVRAPVEKTHRNVIDAAAAGASDGMRLALNIAAMLIAFIAFIALFDAVLGWARPGLTLSRVFAVLFAPAAALTGVEAGDVPLLADLLGTKLVANEFVAYTRFQEYGAELSPRGRVLATYALTGFANFASIGIQIGGIGALAPSRRADLARLGPRALLTGFLVTLLNASLAGLLM
jgi:CNT family concentrative nucleoside transporter